MSQTTDDLAIAVEAIVTRLEELATENATLTNQNASLTAQLATFETQANALEAAALTDTAAEKDATDKLNTALAAATPEPALPGQPSTAELDAVAQP